MSETVNWLIGFLARPRGGERGQMVLLAAGTMVMVIGFAALAVDLGVWTHSKREVQNDADAMALAAVRELTQDGQTQTEREEDAEDIAMEWAVNNDVDPSEVEEIIFGETCSGDAIPYTVTVRLVRTEAAFFARIFGIDTGDLHVCATARTGIAQGGPGLFPIGLLYDDPALSFSPPLCYYHETGSSDPDEVHANFWYDPDDADSEECTIKIPKPDDTWTPGNSGPLRLDEGGDSTNWDGDCNVGSSGSSEYTENIVDGSECGYSLGDEIRTKTGSMNTISCDAVDDKIDGNTDPISVVFTDPDGDRIFDIVDETHPRFAIIPVVYVPPGSSGTSTEVEVRAFVPIYIVGCTETGSGGNTVANTVVVPVRADIYVEGIDFVDGGDLDDFDSDWPMWTIKLVE